MEQKSLEEIKQTFQKEFYSEAGSKEWMWAQMALRLLIDAPNTTALIEYHPDYLDKPVFYAGTETTARAYVETMEDGLEWLDVSVLHWGIEDFHPREIYDGFVSLGSRFVLLFKNSF
jgi:hypothetical protein